VQGRIARRIPRVHRKTASDELFHGDHVVFAAGTQPVFRRDLIARLLQIILDRFGRTFAAAEPNQGRRQQQTSQKPLNFRSHGRNFSLDPLIIQSDSLNLGSKFPQEISWQIKVER